MAPAHGATTVDITAAHARTIEPHRLVRGYWMSQARHQRGAMQVSGAFARYCCAAQDDYVRLGWPSALKRGRRSNPLAESLIEQEPPRNFRVYLKSARSMLSLSHNRQPFRLQQGQIKACFLDDNSAMRRDAWRNFLLFEAGFLGDGPVAPRARRLEYTDNAL